MKLFLLLFLFLLSFKVLSYPKHSVIDAMTVNNRLYVLMQRMSLSIEGCSIEERVNEDDVRSKYERFNCSGKPTFIALQNELTDYKAFLHVERTKEVNEINRRKDIKNRLKALNFYQESFYSVISDVPNHKDYFRKNIPTMNHAQMEQLIKDIEAKNAARQIRQDEEDQDKIDFRTLRLYFKNFNCASLGSEYEKNSCEYRKIRK